MRLQPEPYAMPKLNVYLHFQGDCESAFNFYKSIFGGEFEFIGRYKDIPKNVREENFPFCSDDQIMHISLPISKETMLMGSDLITKDQENSGPTSTFSLYVSTETKKEAERIFAALSDEGDVVVPMEQQFWGSYYGLTVDKFGIAWKISCSTDQVR